MNERPIFSIVVPVYQNEDNLGETIPALLALGERLPDYRLELVFVDDGSTDHSHALLLDAQARHPDSIVVVKLTRNFGQSPAIREGLRVARGRCIGIISADLQDPPELFLEMVAHWERGVKLVIAERTARDDGPLHGLISNLYWGMVGRYALHGFPKGGFDFCLIDRRLRDDLAGLGEKESPIFPLLFWLGYPHVTIPYTRRARSRGRSQWTLGKKLALTVSTFINFTYLPVKLMALFGIAISVASLLYSSYVVAYWFISGTGVPGWTTIVMLVSLLGGLILLSLSIIGEYLWRILDETRRRPGAVVERVVGGKDEGEGGE